MKNILFIISIITFNFSFSQEKYRVTNALHSELLNKTGSLSLFQNITIVENVLDENNSVLKYNSVTSIKQPPLMKIKEEYNGLSSSKKKWVDNNVCLSCYDKEWQYQNDLLSNIIINEKRKSDSLVIVRQEAIRLNILREDSIRARKDSIATAKKADRNPYYNLRDLCYRKNDNTYILPFIGLDFNFSGGNLETYLQSKLNLNSGSVSTDGKTFKQHFSSKLNPDKNHLTVNYSLNKQEGKIGYLGTTPAIIKSVDIIGTSDLIINLYISYWDTRFKYVGDRANGMIIESNYWGDLITLHRISSTQMKITIRGGSAVNYEKEFGIHKPKP